VASRLLVLLGVPYVAWRIAHVILISYEPFASPLVDRSAVLRAWPAFWLGPQQARRCDVAQARFGPLVDSCSR
jgi:hypothetical protein